MPLSDLLPALDRALDAEIEAARQQGGTRYRLTDGHEIGQAGRAYLYRFKLARPCSVPDDAGVSVRSASQPAGQDVDGIAVAVDEQEIVLALEERLEDASKADMAVKLWYILEQLRGRLGHPSRRAATIFDLAGPLSTSLTGTALAQRHIPDLPGLNADQRQAVAVGHQAGVRFIWGPPGTGKTRTIGYLAALAAAEGDRVLIVAFSNDALDVAALNVAESAQRLAHASSGRNPALDDLQMAGRIIRIGAARHPDVVAHPTLTPLAALRHQRPELVRQHDDLRAEERDIRSKPRPDTARLTQIRNELRTIRQALRAEEDRLTREARVVLCTFARLATSDVLSELQFDTVIVDEASMASIPFAALAATSSQRTVVFAGDFRQLPPVVQTRDDAQKYWLERNVFDHAGIPERIASGRGDDPRMVLLGEQHRMTPSISERVSQVFYGGRLRTSATVKAKAYDGAAVVDISDLWPYCQAEPRHLGHSRFNVMSALVSLALARRAAHDLGGTVGIVAPFSAQANLLRLLARDVGLAPLRISTVHRFQGGEVDVMILDLTTARGHGSLGYLLGGDPWSTAGRLLNVAASRARRTLLIVADMNHLERRWRKLDTPYSNEALYRFLDGLPHHQLRPNDLRNEYGEFVLPTLPGRAAEAAKPAPTWPIRYIDGDLFHGRAAQSIELPTKQLLIAVRGGDRPAAWVDRARNAGVEMAICGKDVHPDWRERFGHHLTIEYSTPCNAMVADGTRFAVSLRALRSDDARTVIVQSPSAARLVASLAGLEQNGIRIIPTNPYPVPIDLPPSAGGETPTETVCRPPVPVPPYTASPSETEPGAPDAPSICPVSQHRMKLLLTSWPMRLKCTEETCSFNHDEEAVVDEVGGRALSDGEAVGLLRRTASVYLAGRPADGLLFCANDQRMPRVRRQSRGLAFECPGCNGWLHNDPGLPAVLLVP